MQHITAATDPKASHNCFAYKIGAEFRSTDDGEPGGTAGRPILRAIETEGLDHVCVLIIRYFGGTKLGAGGLVRAYGGAARECLRASERKFVPKMVCTSQLYAA
jgi:putative IMPACT (imprinted ancient) family translation regulator